MSRDWLFGPGGPPRQNAVDELMARYPNGRHIRNIMEQADNNRPQHGHGHGHPHLLYGENRVPPPPSNDVWRERGVPGIDTQLDAFDRELLSHGRPALQSLDIDSNPRLTLPPLHGTPTFANHPGLSLPPPTLFTRPTSRSTFQEIPRQASSNQFPSSVDLSSATRQITHRDQPRHRLRDLQGPFQQETPPLHSKTYTYDPPAQPAVQSSSSDYGLSSPAAKASLRRQMPKTSSQPSHNSQHSSPNITPQSTHNEQYLSPRNPTTPLLNLPHAPPMASGIQLINPREVLPDRFRAVFPYELFNAVQSKCFDSVYSSSDNVVISAPTGSGKTAILELAICKLANMRGDQNFKIVYQAPTKALCSERARDWEKKFNPMSLQVAELTGDTSQTELRRVGKASIVVTTPEKWDSITRKWSDHRKLLEIVELFLIDEVHMIKDVRGATLEAVVSRMKTIGANVRFVALSATVPNSDDIAKWLGRDHTNPQLPARRETFGEEFRPVKLQKYVYGYDTPGNDYVFDRYLDGKLPFVIAKHTRQKPVMVFCFTRKSCQVTAVTLAETWSAAPPNDKMWPAPSKRVPVINPELQHVVRFGVAFHHAGLDLQDRTAIEKHYLEGDLSVICCTSTLAVGVNLPCHTVVLKGTVGFQDSGLVEYCDLEVMQMLGRAGRPQFDDSAVAIILTRSQMESRYETMISGQQVLESTLHLNLIEHLNSEVGLRTIKDLESAKSWLKGTFLSVRLRRNPSYYKLTEASSDTDVLDERLEEICERDIKLLQGSDLITDRSTFASTEYGRAMSKFMIQFETMKMILAIPRGVKMRQLLNELCQGTEFHDLRMKQNERSIFRDLNKDNFIHYPFKETVTSTPHKISLMIQVVLGGVELPNTKEFNVIKRQFAVETSQIFDRMNRLVRAFIECKAYDCDAIGTRIGLELARAMTSRSWEGKPSQLLQVAGIGPVMMRKLVSAEIRTVLDLAGKDAAHIERILSRNPPFGKKIVDALAMFPRLILDARITGHHPWKTPDTKNPTVHVEATMGFANTKGVPKWPENKNPGPFVTFVAETSGGNLAHFWRGALKKFSKEDGNTYKVQFEVQLSDHDEQIICHFACEEIVGTLVSRSLKHDLPWSAFAPKPPPSPVVGVKSDDDVKVAAKKEDDDDDIKDEDMLQVIQYVEHGSNKSKPKAKQEDEDEFPLVEELLEHEADPQTGNGNDDLSQREPVRLANGKWMCNHACATRGTKAGKPCAHRCCREGLDNPRKLGPKKPKMKRENNEDAANQAAPSTQQAGRSTSVKRQKLGESSKPKSSGSKPPGSNPPSKKQATLLPARPKPRMSFEEMGYNMDDVKCIDLSNGDDNKDGQQEDDIQYQYTSSTSHRDNSRHGSSKEGKTEPSGSTAHQNDVDQFSVDKQPEEDEYGSDVFEDMMFPETAKQVLGSQEENTVNSDVFKLGASNETLFPGISKSFSNTKADARSGEMSPNTRKMFRESSRLLDLPMSSSFTNNDGQETFSLVKTHTQPQQPTEQVFSPPPRLYSDDLPKMWDPEDDELAMAKSMTIAETAAQTEPMVVDTPNDEPEWLNEFESDFVDEFRGFVNFT